MQEERMKIICVIFIFSFLLSCAETIREGDLQSPDEEIQMSDEDTKKLIDWINKQEKQGNSLSEFLYENSTKPIVDYLEKRGGRDKAAWKALDQLEGVMDGELGSRIDDLIYEFDKSEIPVEIWFKHLNTYWITRVSTYQELLNEMRKNYYIEYNDQLKKKKYNKELYFKNYCEQMRKIAEYFDKRLKEEAASNIKNETGSI